MADSNMPTTQWSIVLGAGQADLKARMAALEQLARLYRRPVYEFIVRYQGGSARDAEDLTQEVFATLMKGSGVAAVNPEVGRFRRWLLSVVKHCVANHHRDENRQRRDVRKNARLSDLEHLLPSDSDAEIAYHRAWIQAQYQRALKRLEAWCEERGELGLYREVMRENPGVFFGEEGERGSYPQLAATLGLSQSNLKVKVLRLRERCWLYFREEVQRTVGTVEQVDEEIAALLAALE
jgi:RNA polymerase sigma factor (sigma-70 family)